LEREEIEQLVKEIRLQGGKVDDPSWVQEEKAEIQREKMRSYDAMESEWKRRVELGLEDAPIDFSKGSFFVPPKAGTRL